MKKIIAALLLICVTIAGFAKTPQGGIPKEKLLELISEYSGKDGFEVVNIGSFGTSALKTVMRAAVQNEDEEARKILKAMKGINKMAIVDYDKCDGRTREVFNARLEKILSKSELLIEAKDDDDTMKIYGVTDEENGTVHDFVMYVPNDCALICLFGSIQMDTIMELAAK